MLGGSEVVVGTSIASYDLADARIMVLWRSAAAAPPPPPNPTPLHASLRDLPNRRLSDRRARAECGTVLRDHVHYFEQDRLARTQIEALKRVPIK